jgi:hypothetical protein
VPAEGIRVVDATIALAWVSDTHQAKLSRDARDAARATVEHDRVIGSAIAQGVTPIPASLADPYDDDASMLADLSRREKEIELAFEMVAGKVEMTTIIALNDVAPAEDAPGRGTAYLEQIRSAPARAASIADRIANSQHAEFGEARRRGERGNVALSHLIPRDRIDRYRTLTLAQSGRGYRIVVDGPRAPYSFALLSPQRGTILAT